MKIEIRRVYESLQPSSEASYRVLIDRLWPRGVSKQELQFDSWEKELAPSPGLRKWFGHAPERWEIFQEKYAKELEAAEMQRHIKGLISAADGRHITLLYGSRDPEHNHALVLAEAIRRLY